jgi:hypothetical protein
VYWKTHDPGDNDGALGPTYAVFKVNNEFLFQNRSTGSTSADPDTTFWGTSWSGGTMSPLADGHVYYDPYGPAGACSGTGGRWLAIEMGQLKLTNGNYECGILYGISSTDDPTGAWHLNFQFDPNYVNSTACSSRSSYPDFPQLGFNTNWIAWTANSYYANNNNELYFFSRQDAECGGVIDYNHDYANSVPSACPAETYHPSNSDPDSATLYFINVENYQQGTVQLSEITGTLSSPTVNVSVASPSVGSSYAWYFQAPEVPQSGSSAPKVVADPDDRFTGCVVRNGNIWATQTVGLPATSPTSAVVQFWGIGVDSQLATIANFGRIGGKSGLAGLQANAMSSSIAVNSDSDLLVGYSEVPVSSSGSGTGHLGSAYSFFSHYKQSIDYPYVYQPGTGIYQTPGGLSMRTGDYSHTVVDPNDNLTFWMTEGFAGSKIGTTSTGTNVYSWESSYASVPPPAMTVIGSQNVESECPNKTGSPCSLTFTASSNSQPGDVLVLQLDAAGPNAALPTLPAGWQVLNATNQGNAQRITSSDSCGYQETEWVAVYQYGSVNPEPGSYTVSVPLKQFTTCNGSVTGEFGGLLISYRGASTAFANYTLYGYPHSGDTTTVSAGQISASADSYVLNLFRASADDTSNESTETLDFTSPSGSPTTVPETPINLTGDVFTAFGADVGVGSSGATVGSYSTTASASGLVAGWQLVIPPL